MLGKTREAAGTNVINNTQIKPPRQILKKQVWLFLPNHGFLRPKNHTAMMERPRPDPAAKRSGVRKNIAIIQPRLLESSV